MSDGAGFSAHAKCCGTVFGKGSEDADVNALNSKLADILEDVFGSVEKFIVAHASPIRRGTAL